MTKRTIKRECDGKFAITSFGKVKQFESAANDRSHFVAICQSVGQDGYMFSAPKGFAGWTFEKQMAEVVYLFNLQPVAVTIPVSVAV